MKYLTFEKIETYNREAWFKEMFSLGSAMKDNNVKHVIFTHGTFAGNDTLGIIRFLKSVEEALTNSTAITSTLNKKAKRYIDRSTTDLGNFTEDYVSSFKTGINNGLACSRFIWSGDNHHMARLDGAVNLIHKLADIKDLIDTDSNSHLLIIGHSHAGQLFALITMLLENMDKAHPVFNTIEKTGFIKKDRVFADLKKISGLFLDFVTFGTPVRYFWGNYDKFRLLNVINHRSETQLSGLLTTRDGDYVQQWGTEGTDIFSRKFKKLNEELDEILDKGQDFSLIRKKLYDKQRKLPLNSTGESVGETLLVNYRDNAAFSFASLKPFRVPHSVKTLFGHGIYTRKEAMLFNTKTIVDEFYSE